MERLKDFRNFVNEDYSEKLTEAEKWISGAIKRKGSLRRKMRKAKGERITQKEIDSELAALRRKDKDKDEPGLQLGASDRRKHKQLVLAKTLRGFN
jgi:hypothetical protein